MKCEGCGKGADSFSANMAKKKYGKPLCDKCYVIEGARAPIVCMTCGGKIMGVDPIIETSLRDWGEPRCTLCYVKPKKNGVPLRPGWKDPMGSVIRFDASSDDPDASAGKCEMCGNEAKRLFARGHDQPMLCHDCFANPASMNPYSWLATQHAKGIIGDHEYTERLAKLMELT